MLNQAIGGFSRLSRELPKLASGIAVEAGWITAHLVMYPLGALTEPIGRSVVDHAFDGLRPEQRGLVHAGVDAASTPILLVHGIIDNHSIFTVLEHALRRRGFRDLSWFDYGLLTADVRKAAVDLGQAIERLTKQSGYERIHIVGHSLGGLIARYYIQRMGGDAQVHTLVTLGTPHAGTALAKVGRMFPLVHQLTPTSDLITELAEPAPDCRTRFVAFYSDLDQLIVPSRRARIDHPDLAARNIPVHRVGHLSMPNNSRIAFQIASVLRELDPEPAADDRGGA